MIVDHRTYDVIPGKLPSYVELYKAKGWPLQKKYLQNCLGWYISMDIGTLSQIVHMWGYESLQDRVERRARLAADPAWQDFLKEAMPMLQRMENKILSPVAMPD